MPTFDDGSLIRAIKQGAIEIVPEMRGFSATGDVIVGERTTPVDVVIAATGYRTALEQLVGHVGLASNGRPVVRGGETTPAALGLYFLGFTDPFTGNPRQIRLDAKAIAKQIAAR